MESLCVLAVIISTFIPQGVCLYYLKSPFKNPKADVHTSTHKTKNRNKNMSKQDAVVFFFKVEGTLQLSR